MREKIFFYNKNKKGEVLSSSIIKIIAEIIVTVSILILIARFISPVFDSGGNTAEAYLDKLKDVVSEVDEGKAGNFYIVDNGKDDLDFYLVYFGDKLEFSTEEAGIFFDSDIVFAYLKGQSENTICICYDDDTSVRCNDCFNLKIPANLNSFEGEVWVIEEGVNLEINKDKDKYDFLKK